MAAAMDRALLSLSKLRAKSSKDLTTISQSISRDYPSDPACYDLLEDCGRGVSATVHRAFCKTADQIVAVKKMNLERVNMKLEDIIHEAQTMKSYHHPNVLPLYTSFVHGQDLWMVTPFMSGGSVLHIMKYRFPKGLDEVSIATIMKYVLLGLEYVHKNGGIHRDVKAGNILMDKDGVVRIGDFGVAATPAARDGDWCDAKNQQRTTFVGTPCWMAPEVMEQVEYNSRADIWSVGITMLEMANGHAPFAKFPPMKVLLMTLQGPAPQLDDQPGRPHFSKHMRNVIARCLQKDPNLRPTATELLQDKFFKQARDEEYLQNLLLRELPALGERVQMIREGKAATNAAENDRQLERSQEEYKRGVSMWNFDVASLKAQAALDEGGSAPGLASIAEEPQQIVEGEGSGSSSRRSTDDAAGVAPVAAPAAAAAGAAAAAAAVVAATGAAAAAPPAAGAVQQQQQQPAEVLQQQLPPLSVPSLPRVPSLGKDVAQQQQAQQQAQQQQPQQQAQQQQPQQPPQQTQPDAAAAAPQQQQRLTLPRAASAFAGSHELAAAVAEMGGGGSSSSSSGPGLLSHHSEPASQAVSHQGSGIPGQQPSSSGMPPPAPYAGAAYTGLSSGSLAGAGASSGGSSYCLSPPNTSPPMSRESSSQGPLSSLATPEALQLRGKSKGRFQVYEHGVPAPPLSPGTRIGSLTEGLSGSFSKGTPTAAAAAAAAVSAADGTSAAPAAGPNLARVSDSAGGTTETPRAGRQVLNPAEAAELKAAAVAATAAAGTTGGGAPPASGAPAAAAAAAATMPPAAPAAGDATGGATGTSTCPTPPQGTAAGAAAAAAAVGAAGAGLNLPTGTSVSVDEAPTAPEPKKKGRFKIIEEENVSRAPSKVSSSADLAAAARAAAGSGRSLTSTAGVLPELLRLHEQSVVHANALARVIDSVRASCSGLNLVGAEDLQVPATAAGAGTLPPRKPAAAGAGGSSSTPAGILSRVNSGRGLAVLETKVVSLQQLLQDANGDPMELAERLYDRVQDLERQVSGLELDITRLRSPELRLRPLEGSGGSTSISAAPSGILDSVDPSRASSRRASIAQLALSAASPTAAAAAAAAAVGSSGSNGVERHSSSGASGGGAEGGAGSGGGAGPTPV